MLIRTLHGAGYGAIEINETSVTVLIGEDTDLLVLLLLHTLISCRDVYPIKVTPCSNKETKLWHIQRCQENIGLRVCHNMLFAYAIGRAGVCDTTIERLYGISKTPTTDDTFMHNAKNVYKEGMTLEAIATAGERLLVTIYGGGRDAGDDHATT